MFWPIIEYVEEWELPLVPTSGHGAPTQIVDACGAVGRDLHHRRHGPAIDLGSALWTVSLMEDGWCHVGLDRSASSSVSFAFGGTHIDQSLEDATVRIADAVQTELAGHPPYVQWPIEERRLLLPSVRDGVAVWRDPRTDDKVCDIGLLASAS